MGEAERAVRNSIEGRDDVDNDALADEQTREPPEETQVVGVNTVESDGRFVDLKVTFDDEWDPRSDAIAQVGLLGDESGRNKFVAFKGNNLTELEEGQSYLIENAVTDEYQGDYSVKFDETTVITEIDEDIEVNYDSDNDTETITGAIVDINTSSGLIVRCAEDGCTRTIGNGSCREHGDNDGQKDMRLKAVLDTGNEVLTAIFDMEKTIEATGITFDEAESIAKDALDRTAVLDEMKPDIVGRYYTITGSVIENDDQSDTILVDEFDAAVQVETDPEETLVKARSI
jgi:replication factor A1